MFENSSLNGNTGDHPVDCPTSVTKVTENTELLTEILLRLPPKFLLHLQTVCKDWFSLISSQKFRLLHCRKKHMSSVTVDGLFFCWWVYSKNYLDFIPINDMPKKQKGMAPLALKNISKCAYSKIEHLHSCNGLFCISFNLGDENDHMYYVYNPCTNQHRLIPLPCTKPREVMVMNLAFDPMVSDRYTIVCVMKSEGYYQFAVYSSENGVWRDSTETLDIKQQYLLGQGVFMNGSMHWVSEMFSFLRFDLDSMCFRGMPSTVIPSSELKRNIRYFGESGGHLHLIEVHGYRSMSFQVLEMEIDYSKWFVKYHVDLSSLQTTYPLMLSEEQDLLDVNRRTCNVVCILVDDKEKTTRLLVSTPDVIIEYDSRLMTIKEVTRIDKGKIPSMWEDVSVFEWCDTHQYVEIMASI